MTKNTKRIFIFLAIAFLLMYLSHGLIAYLLKHSGIEWDNFPLNALGILGGGAPAFAALFVVFKLYGEDEQKSYWQRVYRYAVPVQWWVLALLSPLVIGLIANLVYYGGWWAPDIHPGQIAAFPVMFAAMIFAGGAEELGWRGVLQDLLHGKYSPVLIGIGIGLIWAIWHAPLFLIDVFAHYEYCFITYTLSTVLFSLILTLIYFRTKSVLLTILMHAAINAFGNLGFGIPMELHAGVAVVLVVSSVLVSFALATMKRD